MFWFFVGADPGLAVLMRHNLKLYSALTIVMYGVLAVWVMLAQGRLFPFRATGISLLVLAINAVNGISVLFSPVSFQSPPRIYGTMIEWVGISFIVLALARDAGNPDSFRRMGTAFVLGSVLTVLSPLESYHLHFLSVRYGLLALDPNSLGFRAAFALILVLGGEVGWPGPRARGALAMLFAAALILSFSKTAIVGALAGFAALWLLSGRRVEHGITLGRAAAGLLIPLALLWGRLIANTSAYLDNTREFSTLTGRTILWHVTLQLSSIHPWLGYGFDTFQEVVDPLFHGNPQLPGWNATIVHAHDAYLTVLLQVGYIGVTLYALLTLAMIWQLVRLVARRRAPSVPVWIALVLIFLIRSVTEGTFGASGPEFGMLCTLGLFGEELLARDRMPVPAPRPATPPLRAAYRWAR
jgi:O-antigen ligase